MRKLLVTGGTVFVSRFIAEYFAQKGDEVSVLNRNQHPQPSQTTLIEADRHHVGDILKQQSFISDTIPLEEGLLESYLWYQEHKEEVNRKGYMAYIDERLCCT